MHVTARIAAFAIGFTGQQRQLVRAGFTTFLLLGAVQALYGPVLPSVRASFGLSAAAGGWTVGAHYFGSVVGVLLSIVLEGRLRARTRLTSGLMLVSAGSVAFAATHAWPWALIGVLCIGLGYGILVVVVNAQFAAGFGDQSAALVILVNAGFGMGAVIGPLFFGVLSSGNFRPAFFVIGGLAMLVLPLGWAVSEVAMPDDRISMPAGRGIPLVLAGFVGLFCLYTALESDTSGWMATHLVFQGYSQGTASELTAAFWMALTVGRLVSVPISLWLSPFRVIAGSLVGVTILALVARLSSLTAVAYVLIGFMLAPVFPVGLAWMHRTLPRRHGATSVAILGALAGGLIFPVLVGRVIGASSPDALPLALATLAAAGAVVGLSLSRRIRAG